MTLHNQFTEASFIFVETLKDTLINFIDPQIQIFQSKNFRDILLRLNQIENLQNLQNKDELIESVLQLNQHVLYELKKLIQQQKITKNAISQSQDVEISQQDYKILQKAVQKAQNQIRHHIGTQHQMKILIDQLDEQIQILKSKLGDIQKQNKFYRKQISYLKQKETELQKQIKHMKGECDLLSKQIKKKHSRISNYERSQPMIEDNSISNKKEQEYIRKTKAVTEPSSQQFQGQFVKQGGTTTIKNKDKLLLNKKSESQNDNLKYVSKMSSKKNSQVKFHQGNINVNLTNLVTIESYHVMDEKQSQKEHFWNRRRIKIGSVNQNYDQQKKKKQTENLCKRYGIKESKKDKLSILNKSVTISPKGQLFIQNTIEMKPQIQRRKITASKHKTQMTAVQGHFNMKN